MPYNDAQTHIAPLSRVSDTASRLAALSLGAHDGEFLGSESELIEQLGVSRPTFRQAVKLIQSDKLLTVRKGQGGGLFASRPNASDVIRAPARYLRMQGTSLKDVQIASSPISQLATKLATLCEDDYLQEELVRLRKELSEQDVANASPLRLIESEARLARLISQMNGNPVIQLFMEIGFTFGSDERSVRLYQTASDRISARTLQLKLCDALIEKDAEIAQIMMERRSALIGGWLNENNPTEEE